MRTNKNGVHAGRNAIVSDRAEGKQLLVQRHQTLQFM